MNQERIMKILLSPRVTDKSYRVGDQSNHIVFKVVQDATKPEIKSAVSALFDVEVDSVRVLNVKGKARRFGKIMGKTKDWKKAYVKLMPGQNIDFVGADNK